LTACVTSCHVVSVAWLLIHSFNTVVVKWYAVNGKA